MKINQSDINVIYTQNWPGNNYYYVTPCEFFTPVLTGYFFYWSLSDSKTP